MANNDDEKYRENLAALQHEIWGEWAQSMMNDPTIQLSCEREQRWKRLVNTPYVDLSEVEKDSDRKQADKVLAIFHLPQMPEPDWDIAPHWAVAWAIDAFGGANWWEKVPSLPEARAIWDISGKDGEIFKWHSFDRTVILPLGIDWRQTLQQRPERQTTEGEL